MNTVVMILGVFATLLLGMTISYIINRQKILAVEQLNEEIIQKNREAEIQAKDLKTLIESYHFDEQRLIGEINALQVNMKTAEENAKTAAQAFYDSNMALAVERLNDSLEKEGQKYQSAIEDMEKEYEQIKSDRAQDVALYFQETSARTSEIQSIIDDLESIHNSAVEAAKRKEEMKESTSFYQIQLSDTDKKEIASLLEVGLYLRNMEPLNKVIWKVYYEKPTTDMIGRVIGLNNKTGIYKITNIENQKCYVGQAVNIADRWKQHIKRGLGAETPTRNKLYPAMWETRPENFTFELIEECDRSQLDEKEDYWQDYFKAKEYGYSIK